MKQRAKSISLTLLSTVAFAQSDPAQLLFNKVHVFDSINGAWTESAILLVEGNVIKTTSTDLIVANGTVVVEGDGRILMLGVIAGHSKGGIKV